MSPHLETLHPSLQMLTPPPESFNFARYLLDLNQPRASSLAFIDDQGSITYAHLAHQVRRFGSALRSLGIESGQRVLIVLHDRIEWPVAFLGAMYAGLVPVPVNTLLTKEDYRYLLQHSEAAALVVGMEFLETVREAREVSGEVVSSHVIVVGSSGASLPLAKYVAFETLILSSTDEYGGSESRRDDIAFWLYSSGSTGRPKAVVHTHANLYWTVELYAKPVMGIAPTDRVFSAAKLFFAYGLGNALTFPLSVGASSVLMAERPTPAAVMKRLHDHGATIFCAAPTLYSSILATAEARPPPTLRLCTSAGEALPREIGIKFSERFGAHIIDGLGSTEMLHIFISNKPADIQYGTTGKPVDGYEVELRDDAGLAVRTGQIGDLWVKGPSAAQMYWNDAPKSQSTFQGAWVRTGDKYVRRADGCFVYSGRNDDMLKISGQYVSPFEVESTLMQHPTVLESGVVAVTDASGIPKSKAYVVLKQGHLPSAAAAEELKGFVKTKLAPFKRPHFVEFVESLPKTATGKIQRFRLREKAAASSIP